MTAHQIEGCTWQSTWQSMAAISTRLSLKLKQERKRKYEESESNKSVVVIDLTEEDLPADPSPAQASVVSRVQAKISKYFDKHQNHQLTDGAVVSANRKGKAVNRSTNIQGKDDKTKAILKENKLKHNDQDNGANCESSQACLQKDNTQRFDYQELAKDKCHTSTDLMVTRSSRMENLSLMECTSPSSTIDSRRSISAKSKITRRVTNAKGKDDRTKATYKGKHSNHDDMANKTLLQDSTTSLEEDKTQQLDCQVLVQDDHHTSTSSIVITPPTNEITSTIQNTSPSLTVDSSRSVITKDKANHKGVDIKGRGGRTNTIREENMKPKVKYSNQSDMSNSSPRQNNQVCLEENKIQQSDCQVLAQDECHTSTNPTVIKPSTNEIASSIQSASPSTAVVIASQEKIDVGPQSMVKVEKSEELTPVSAPAGIPQNDDQTHQTSQKEPYLPYYLSNFNIIIQTVRNCKDDVCLFNDEDLVAVDSFYNLSVSAQKLYVRLFLRVYTWFQCSKLKYPDIREDLSSDIEQLRNAGLVEDDDSLTDMEDILNLLPGPEVKKLAKMYHVKSGSKNNIIEALKKLGRQQRGVYGQQVEGVSGITRSVIKRAKSVLGLCIRLQKHPRCVFNRMSLLFALTSATYDDDLANGGHAQMAQLMMVNFGRLVYPEYEIYRPTPVFTCREDFITYDSKLQEYYDINEAFARGDVDTALQLYHDVYDDCKSIINDLLNDENFIGRQLPSYLMQYTPGWVCCQILSSGIGLLEKKRMYKEASMELQYLLQQKVFCNVRRGKWWDRLALILEQHLKQPELSLNAVKEALVDPCIGGGRKLALQQRGIRLCNSPSNKKLHIYRQDIPQINLKDANHITITGRLYPAVGSGYKSVFIRPGEDCSFLCSVEELALYHYLDNEGFTDGLHAEGATLSTLYTLLMWDILFTPGVPDVFRHPFQSAPLDLMHGGFYSNRKDIIEEKLRLIRESDDQGIEDMIKSTWTRYEGRICVGINWERFPNGLPQVQSLALCFGGEILADLCERFSKSFAAGGLPDLVLWNKETKKVKFAEVKGPNDRLSTKQILWIDRIVNWGIDVDVCHVKAIGSKAL
ncbi:uncharacterized protein TRIADDRAFT_54130 [Trichoplax adhaerens]|uniref:Fanconi-associated nuclease n=1 Tax=Trichoplax adhaerens TaxID=10228 RepID=B3RR70_TRIAD|nr:hypothetical protein TRIADDRAFT_54130 [Trichoplax adhaerens]EDV26826.1 hypothetical protein TRIADDRAFT_54130 [Trichoplax adhaerens]|eukprot:XP_002110822.1 hypothetical protein TRIADDRAFT_54130 [Trichoplax adhaerens]